MIIWFKFFLFHDLLHIIIIKELVIKLDYSYLSRMENYLLGLVWNGGFNAMNVCWKRSQFDFFWVLNDTGIRFSPFNGHFKVFVWINEDVKGTNAVKEGKKWNTGRDLTNYCPNVLSYGLLIFFAYIAVFFIAFHSIFLGNVWIRIGIFISCFWIVDNLQTYFCTKWQ